MRIVIATTLSVCVCVCVRYTVHSTPLQL